MAEYTAKDASGTTKYFKAQNTGGSGDGFEQDVNVTDRAARDLGKVDIAAFDAALPAGTNNIGDVDIASFGASLPAGTNNIGDVDVLTGATDDAAAAGQLFPAAGLYQSTVDEVDAGDLGRLRMSARRGLVAVPDYLMAYASSTTVANANDIEASVSLYSGYSAITTAFLNGADAGFDGNPRYVRIPMRNWQSASFWVTNVNLGVNLTLDILQWIGDSTIQNAITLASISLASGGNLHFGPNNGGSGVSAIYYSIPALINAMDYLLLRFTPASDPSTGSIRLAVSRRS